MKPAILGLLAGMTILASGLGTDGVSTAEAQAKRERLRCTWHVVRTCGRLPGQPYARCIYRRVPTCTGYPDTGKK